jgi:protein-L-isoaspartate(D-aspartate) O-methyltransferase
MSDRLAAARRIMVDHQIRRRGINDPRVLAALEGVPRHLFVPAAAREAAYDDSPLPIGGGQTISQPYIVALMTSALELGPSEQVLEVGTGSGYQSAVLACLAQQIHTIELLPELSRRARRVTSRLGLRNIQFHVGDGSLGWPAASPYDAILVTAAAPSVPEPLLQQLGAQGRLIIPVAASQGYQALKLVVHEAGRFSERVLGSVAFVPLHGRFGMQP